jgi:hypothetical protein
MAVDARVASTSVLFPVAFVSVMTELSIVVPFFFRSTVILLELPHALSIAWNPVTVPTPEATWTISSFVVGVDPMAIPCVEYLTYECCIVDELIAADLLISPSTIENGVMIDVFTFPMIFLSYSSAFFGRCSSLASSRLSVACA